MRKMIYGGLFLAAVGIGVVGCKKEQALQTEDRTSLTKLNHELDNIPIISPSDGNEIIVRNDDDEIKLNQLLFELASATEELIKDASFNKFIIETAKESNTETVYYSQIKEKAPHFYEAIDLELKEVGTSIEAITENMTHKPILPNPKYPETEEIEIYEPAITIPNIENIDENRMPLISPNLEKVYNDETYILSWYFDENNKKNEILIGEETALNTTNPIFILNHCIPRLEMEKIGDFLGNSTKNSTQFQQKSNSEYRISHVQIKNGYRYEQGLALPRSEFAINAVVVYNDNTPPNFVYLFFNNNLDNSQTVTKVNGSTIENSAFLSVNEFFSINYENYPPRKVYWNTFERDWNRGLINLGNGTTYGKTWYIQGKARYSGDWYQWIPSTTSTHEFPYHWYGWESSVTFSSWKSGITIYPE